MKQIIFCSLLLLSGVSFKASAQQATSAERYGHTLNLGLGLGGYYGYYGYIGHTLPVFHVNYEFDVARNFTLAPFLTLFTYRDGYYWGDPNHGYPYGYYYHHETVIPIGVKGTYYFDHLLNANPNWDFYLAGSLGFAIVSSTWDNGYYGDRNYYRNANPLFLDLHIGAEYHINDDLGVFLDLSTGVSTIGVAIH